MDALGPLMGALAPRRDAGALHLEYIGAQSKRLPVHHLHLDAALIVVSSPWLAVDGTIVVSEVLGADARATPGRGRWARPRSRRGRSRTLSSGAS